VPGRRALGWYLLTLTWAPSSIPRDGSTTKLLMPNPTTSMFYMHSQNQIVTISTILYLDIVNSFVQIVKVYACN